MFGEDERQVSELGTDVDPCGEVTSAELGQLLVLVERSRVLFEEGSRVRKNVEVGPRVMEMGKDGVEEGAHERIRTLIGDFEVLMMIDGGEQILVVVDGRWLMFFRSEEEQWVGLRDDFCRMDLTALRSQTVSLCFPPLGFERSEQTVGGVAPLCFSCLVLV